MSRSACRRLRPRPDPGRRRGIGLGIAMGPSWPIGRPPRGCLPAARARGTSRRLSSDRLRDRAGTESDPAGALTWTWSDALRCGLCTLPGRADRPHRGSQPRAGLGRRHPARPPSSALPRTGRPASASSSSGCSSPSRSCWARCWCRRRSPRSSGSSPWPSARRCWPAAGPSASSPCRSVPPWRPSG